MIKLNREEKILGKNAHKEYFSGKMDEVLIDNGNTLTKMGRKNVQSKVEAADWYT